jgi:hypothetical protein
VGANPGAVSFDGAGGDPELDYNLCPTDPADVVVPNENGRDLIRMRRGLVP